MSASMLAAMPPEAFTPKDQAAAREASRALARLNDRGLVHVEAAPENEQDATQTFVLPAAAVRMLTDILVYLAEGRGVSILPTNTALTTQQAADMLNVSRPYLSRLLTEGKLPFHMVGTHRRVALQDLLAYRDQGSTRSRAARDRLAAEAQELNMGY